MRSSVDVVPNNGLATATAEIVPLLLSGICLALPGQMVAANKHSTVHTAKERILSGALRSESLNGSSKDAESCLSLHLMSCLIAR